MPTFSIKRPYFIIVLCLFVCVLGLTSLFQMPVDMFPPIEFPVILVATFYNGMPPRQIEADITDTFEQLFTLGSGIDHIQSRSIGVVSLIPCTFSRERKRCRRNADVQPGDGRSSAASSGYPSSRCAQHRGVSLPVCLLTVEGKGMNETQLHDYLPNIRFETRSQAFPGRPFHLRMAGSTAR